MPTFPSPFLPRSKFGQRFSSKHSHLRLVGPRRPHSRACLDVESLAIEVLIVGVTLIVFDRLGLLSGVYMDRCPGAFPMTMCGLRHPRELQTFDAIETRDRAFWIYRR